MPVLWREDIRLMVLLLLSASMKVLRRLSNAFIVSRRAATRRKAGLSLLAKSSISGKNNERFVSRNIIKLKDEFGLPIVVNLFTKMYIA